MAMLWTRSRVLLGEQDRATVKPQRDSQSGPHSKVDVESPEDTARDPGGLFGTLSHPRVLLGPDCWRLAGPPVALQVPVAVSAALSSGPQGAAGEAWG